MSFGFLTESALLPSKSKPIKVDGRSLVDLKAVVYAKEQKVKLDGGGGSGGLRGLRGKRRAAGDAGDGGGRKDPFARSNRGVEDRSQRDELERVTASKKRKAAQRVMAAKSSLYEKMAKGEVAGVSRAGSLVDFSRKTGEDLALLEAKARKPKSRRHNSNGGGKSGPRADSDDDDDDDDDGSGGGGGKNSKKRPRGGKGRGSGARSGSGGEDEDGDSAGGRGGYFSDDDDGGGGGSGGGYGAEVEIVDEFGRHRTVARGSREHREHLQAKKRAAEAKAEQLQQQSSHQAAAMPGSASSSFDDRYSYRGNRGAPPPPPPPPPASRSSSSSYAAAANGDGGSAAGAPPGGWAWSSGAGRGADAGDFETREGQERQAKKGMAELLEREGGGGREAGTSDGGAKILSQWEKTLTGDQKTYLREVEQETEVGRRRAAAAGGDRRIGREKQRSERKELLRRKQDARAARLRGERG